MQFTFHRGDHNTILLGALISAILFTPYVEPGTISRYIFNFLLSLVMVSGAIAAAQTHGKAKLVGIVLAAALLASWLIAYSTQSSALNLIHFLEILFLAVVATSVMGKVLGPGAVTMDKIAGAISVYLLAGLIMGLACQLLEGLAPGSFMNASTGKSLTGPDLVYFGYVTLTTLGYGDIIPVTAKARSIAMFGAIFGPLYVAVLIARLVSGYEGDMITDAAVEKAEADPSSAE